MPGFYYNVIKYDFFILIAYPYLALMHELEPENPDSISSRACPVPVLVPVGPPCPARYKSIRSQTADL